LIPAGAHAGPIIERESITLIMFDKHNWEARIGLADSTCWNRPRASCTVVSGVEVVQHEALGEPADPLIEYGSAGE